MKRFTQIIRKSIKLTGATLGAAVLMSGSALVALSSTPVAAATTSTACTSTTTAPATTYGQVKQTVTVATAGTYRLWSRIKAPDTTNNSYYFQVDGLCVHKIGDSTSIPANAWTWVNYQGGSTSTPVDLVLTAGPHNLTYTGSEPNVQLDELMLLASTTCVPTGLGTNCVNQANPPTVTINAPANGAQVTAGSTLNITASASSTSSTITKVDFLVDGQIVSTDTTSPYSYAWKPTNSDQGQHSLTAVATDGTGTTGTSSAVSVTVNPTTTPPPPPGPGPNPGGTPGDANHDNSVDSLDFALLYQHQNDTPIFTAIDFNADGKINAADLSILISHWTQ